MTDPANSHSPTEFQRNVRNFSDRPNQIRQPLRLTVNGQVQAVLPNPKTFQVFEDFLEQQNFIAALQVGLQDLDAGRTQSLESVKAEMKARYGF